MIDLLDGAHCPTADELSGYVQNPVFDRFCADVEAIFGARPKTEFSRCSMMPGWNLKYRKGGRGLCTVYPHESFFTVLVVIGQKQQAEAELLLPVLAPEIQEIYRAAQPGNGQRWLMIDIADAGACYDGTMQLIRLRRK